MQINITLLIQIINFLITYKVLDAFLFRPAIDSLEAKQKKKASLKNQIKSQEEKLLTIEKEKNDTVVAFQEHVKKTYPFSPVQTIEKPLELNLTLEQVKKEKQEAVIDATQEKALTDWLVEKVPHEF